MVTIKQIPTEIFQVYLQPYVPDEFRDKSLLAAVSTRGRRLPPLNTIPNQIVLSNRRNKGKLLIDGETVCRAIDLEFLNSGVNDGLSSAIVREISILKSLCPHPHIVPIDAVWYVGETNLLNIQYPKQELSLREVIDARDELDVSDIANQLCRGLAYIHGAGFVHRNLKPENLFLSKISNGLMTLTIGDFASARYMPSRPTQLLHPLTPEDVRMRAFTEKERIRMIYRAPELLLRLSDYDYSVDVWSAGVVIMELILHTVPWFNSTSESETLMRIFDFCQFEQTDCDVEMAFSLRFASFPKKSHLIPEYMAKLLAHPGGNLVMNMVKIGPKKRPRISACLCDPFLLGRRIQDPPPLFSPPPLSPLYFQEGLAAVSLQPLCVWVPFLVRAARVLQSPNNMIIHAAISLVSSSTCPISVQTILASLKLASRYSVSRDSYKQLSCKELCRSVAGISDTSLIEAEMNLIQRRDPQSITLPFTDHIAQIAPTAVYMLAHFVWDLSMLDETVSTAPTYSQCLAAVIVARQWISNEERIRVHADFASIDDIQILVSKCVLMVNEKKSRFNLIANDDGTSLKLLECVYRDKRGSIIPNDIPSVWNTSRSYIASVLEEGRRTSVVSSTPVHRRLLRSSTLQHAAEWMGRRRLSMTSRKRSRSATPITRLSKRQNSSQYHDENVDPNVPPPFTPRRSARLLKKIS